MLWLRLSGLEPSLHRKPVQARAEAGFKQAAWGRQRPALLIFIRPLSTPGLLPAARAPSQNPPGIQNPRIVLLSDSISGAGRGFWRGLQRAWCSAGVCGPCSCFSSVDSPLTPSLMLSAGKDVDGGYINQWSAIGFSEQARAITA